MAAVPYLLGKVIGMTSAIEPPESRPEDTIDQMISVSGRTSFPLRRSFLQQKTENGKLRSGPLASLVRAGDLKGLRLYLLLLTKASKEPWDSSLHAAVWARALGLDLPTSKTATSAISKAWLRLERHKLITRSRRKRLAVVTLLREDGSGLAYTHPAQDNSGGTYLRVPTALWLNGPDAATRWYQILELPELAVLLIARSLGDNFRLPYEEAPNWYGISADTVARGVDRLVKKNVIKVDKTFKKAPLSPLGYTAEHRYTLCDPFGPIGKLSASSRKTTRKEPF